MTRIVGRPSANDGYEVEPVTVMRGRHAHATQFGPLPGARLGNVVAFDFELPPAFTPWPGRPLIQRTFVLLDIGVSLANPCWMRWARADGGVVDRSADGPDSWYVDLISVEQHEDVFTFRDMYVDELVPMDGRPYRVLDLAALGD